MNRTHSLTGSLGTFPGILTKPHCLVGSQLAVFIRTLLVKCGNGAVAGCIRHGLRLLLATSVLQTTVYRFAREPTCRLPNAFSVHSVNRDRFTLCIHFVLLNLDVVL